jgi:hypothetical protein
MEHCMTGRGSYDPMYREELDIGQLIPRTINIITTLDILSSTVFSFSNTALQKLYLFASQGVRNRKVPTDFGRLQRASLDFWTIFKNIFMFTVTSHF